MNLGVGLIEINELEKAAARFRQILALPDRVETPASNHTLAHYNLAIILKRQGNRKQSLAEVKAALAITPDFEQAQLLIKQLQE